ncbi:hypothetical protein BDB01DRAFT_837398 [Pilobolus umbonatus]|nr:hypothetical protein BDB01DRAFT_837398 [Pilobolus umbonatus]
MPTLSNLLDGPPTTLYPKDNHSKDNQYTTDMGMPYANSHSPYSPGDHLGHYTSNAPIISSNWPTLLPADSRSKSVSHTYTHPSPLQDSSGKDTIPPLQGDDPPQRLRLPLIEPTIPSTSINTFYKSTFSPATNWNKVSPKHDKPSSPYPFSKSRSSSLSIDSEETAYAVEDVDTEYTYEEECGGYQPDTPPLPVPNTRIVFDPTGHPILKRKRGRPPTVRDSNWEGGWTFLTPTVWTIQTSEEQKDRENNAICDSMDSHRSSDVLMNKSMVAFTNSNMDTLLQMPRKKRGRKPKNHIVGNSCFVWKDLTAARTSKST